MHEKLKCQNLPQVVQTHVKKIRLGMLQQPSKDDEAPNDAAEDEEEREVERYDNGEGGGADEEEVEDFFANMVGGQQVVSC